LEWGLGVVGHTQVLVRLKGLIDPVQEQKRLQKKHMELLKEQQGLYGRLSNTSFLQQAPPEVVETSKARLNELNQQLKTLEQTLATLK
jgi:valyl-tRNA synthetase